MDCAYIFFLVAYMDLRKCSLTNRNWTKFSFIEIRPELKQNQLIIIFMLFPRFFLEIRKCSSTDRNWTKIFSTEIPPKLKKSSINNNCHAGSAIFFFNCKYLNWAGLGLLPNQPITANSVMHRKEALSISRPSRVNFVGLWVHDCNKNMRFSSGKTCQFPTH